MTEEFLDGPDVVAVLKQPVEKRGDYPSLFRITLERLANFRGSPGIHAADLAQLIVRGLGNLLQTPEPLEESIASDLTDPDDGI